MYLVIDTVTQDPGIDKVILYKADPTLKPKLCDDCY